MFHYISFSPHFIVHVSSHFLESTLHCSCFIFISFSPQSISFISPTTVHLVHIYLITWSFNHIVSFTFQPILSLEINDLRMSLDKFLILDRYSLLEADLRCFYYSLSLYIKQEMQQSSFSEGKFTPSQLYLLIKGLIWYSLWIFFYFFII